MAGRTRLGVRLGVGLTTLVLALLAAELYFRAFAPVKYRRPDRGVEDDWAGLIHRPSDTPGLAYELNPGRTSVHSERSKTITVNSLGMRGAEPRPDEPGLRRIVVLGDSVSFGLGVEDDETWPHLLDVRLRGDEAAGGPAYDVLNLAVSGYSTLDEWHQLAAQHEALDPDLVIVGYFLNDPQTEPANPLHAHFAPTLWWQHSHLLRKIASIRKQRDRERYGLVDGQQDYLHYLHKGPPFQSVLRGFDGIAELSRERGFPVAVVIFPSYRRKRTWENYFYRDVHAQVAAAAEERGFLVFDMLPVFESSGHTPEELRIDNWHPSSLGHGVAAAAIHAWLVEHAGELFSGSG